MRHRLFTILAANERLYVMQRVYTPIRVLMPAAATVLCIGLIALAVSSYWRIDKLQINKPAWRSVGVLRGSVYLAGSGNPNYQFPFYSSEAVSPGVRYAVEEPLTNLWIVRWGGQWNGYWFIASPLWLPIILGVPASLASWRRLLRRGNLAGLCPTCGYDLRASTDRCPECGTPIPATHTMRHL